MSKTDWLQARLSRYPTTIIGSSMLPTPGFLSRKPSEGKGHGAGGVHAFSGIIPDRSQQQATRCKLYHGARVYFLHLLLPVSVLHRRRSDRRTASSGRLQGSQPKDRHCFTHPVSRHPICHDRRLRRVLCQPVLMSTSSNRVTRFSTSLLVWCMDGAVARADEVR